MRVDLFDFELPADRIALRPAEPRDAARLLSIDPRSDEPLQDRAIGDLPALLRPGDALVVNDTRVIPAHLAGERRRGDAVARIEINLHKRDGGDRWHAFARPAKRLRVNEIIRFPSEAAPALSASVEALGSQGDVLLAFSQSGDALDAAIERLGTMPLPPYIARRRGTDRRDADDYQTLFAARPGAVAAPTASLHFTPALVAALKAHGVTLHVVTLHVGAGTFLPVKAADTDDHAMHAEWGAIDRATATALNDLRRNGGRIVAAGTTSLRILESAAHLDGTIAPFQGDTSIFITPGYRFRAVDMLITNFHLPRSTLFMLVAAFSGLDLMRRAYAHAIAQHYRFYSYGDACLLYRADIVP